VNRVVAAAALLGAFWVSALADHGTEGAADQEMLSVEGDISPVHDPAVIKAGNIYYVFCTGGRSGQGVIPIRTSTGQDYMFFHAYFGEGRGRGSALQISTMVWENGWPRVGVLP
jgi:hypothetical protein